MSPHNGASRVGAALRATLATALLVLPIAALARAPQYSPPGAGDSAVLRLSWQLSGTASQTCRPRTQAELDALPAHMRTPELCTQDRASYYIVIRVDDAPADTLRLTRGGARGDRPIYVLDERPLPVGRHTVSVDFLRRDEGGARSIASVAEEVQMERGAVYLVTLYGDPARLVLRFAAAR